MKTIKRILSMMAVALGLVLPLTVSSSKAQQVISYQGLATSNGANLSGSHTITLAIYANPTGGTTLWTETQSGVTFTDGTFNVLIGTVKPLPVFDAGSYNGKPRTAADYFLGVSIDGGAELTPRSQLGASPTAWSARFADSARAAGTAQSSNFADSANAAATATTALSLSPNAGGVVTKVNTLNGAITLVGGGGATVTSNGQTITINSAGGSGSGIQGVQNTDGTINVTNPNGPTATINVNPVKVQSRVTGTAPSGSFITGINQDGTVSSAAPSAGGVGGSGTSGKVPLWSAASTLGNSHLADNGTTLSYSGKNIDVDSAYQLGGVTMLSDAGQQNLFVGKQAGLVNTGAGNGFFGFYAGDSNTSGFYNTFAGSYAGFQNNTGAENTFLGALSGQNNTTGYLNTFSGYHAGYENTFGDYNSFLGAYAGQSNTTGDNNTATGFEALYSNTVDSDNTANGYEALLYNTTGSANTASGCLALAFNETAIYNTASGYVALYNNTGGNANTANGAGALWANTTGGFNTASGFDALESNTTGISNTANGLEALLSNTTGGSNTASGIYALYSSSTGNSNTASGDSALFSNTSGSGNTALGYRADVGSGGLSNATAIGYGTIVSASNAIQLGNSQVTSLYCSGAYAATTANSANMVVTSTGQIMRSTSSARYKTNIHDLDINTDRLYDLRPVSYTSKIDGKEYFGLVAEDVANVLPELAEYARSKDVIPGSSSDELIPDAVKYPMLSVLLLKELKKEHEQVKTQEIAISDLERRLQDLEAAQKTAR